MAVKDSEELKSDERYPLGDYSFRIERSSVPGSTNDKIEAICTDKDGKNARKSIQVLSNAQMSGWYVEANSDTADVYAMIATKGGGGGGGGTVLHVGDIIGHAGALNVEVRGISSGSPVYITDNTMCSLDSFLISYVIRREDGSIGGSGLFGSSVVSYDGEQFSVATYEGPADIEAAYECLFGGGEYGDPVAMLVARFAIDLEDAGGDGPGSDWIDPGDYDPDWEEGDPTHTLYVTVTGALSGRHNDPIEDPSYSYIPADKDTVKDYGCGGDGGHGGGGGAGASTVVVHKFATNQANSKEVTAIARRHGYGSGGGKGGKGGDGCILVYY